jgi:hypothetical protein
MHDQTVSLNSASSEAKVKKSEAILATGREGP